MRKKQTMSGKTKIIWGIVIFIIFVLVIRILGKLSEEQIKEESKYSLREVQKFQRDSIKKATVDSLKKIPLDTDVKNIYNHLKSDKTPIYGLYIDDFNRVLDKAKGTGYINRLNKTIDSLTKLRDFELMKSESVIRKAYQEKLRNVFLDSNLDIKVKVYGKYNEKIKLTYILFSDVWARRFQKEGWLGLIRDQGFKRIELTDGYDYGVYYTYE